MRDPSRTPSGPDSPVRVVANLVVLLLTLTAIGVVGFVRIQRPAPPPLPPLASSPPAAEPKPEPPLAQIEPAPAPTLDREAVARAEAGLDAARRERVRAESALAEARTQAALAAEEALHDLSASRSLPSRVRDPSSRIASAQARVRRLSAERDRLQADLAAVDGTPRPRRKALVDQSPVAKPADGEEYHFEVRRDRVAFIDLDRLLDRVKSDVRLRVRLNNSLRPFEANVGPVGAFSIRYEMGPVLPETLSDALLARGSTFSLRAWEIIPESAGRGETFETALQPASEFARAVNRLNPARSTITMWVYPDGFDLYRKLRDRLHARGFLVAARPLPDGMPIRGSAAGSVSAGQ
jgi:hypothetical protein